MRTCLHHRRFYSAVKHGHGADTSLVRARDREDSKEIEQRAGIDTAISYTRAGGYAYRIAMTRGTWSAYLAAAREAIDRDNFKDAVARKHSE